MAQLFPNALSVRLDGCPLVTAEAAAALAVQLPRLREAHFHHCPALRDVSALLEGCRGSLRTLSVSHTAVSTDPTTSGGHRYGSRSRREVATARALENEDLNDDDSVQAAAVTAEGGSYSSSSSYAAEAYEARRQRGEFGGSFETFDLFDGGGGMLDGSGSDDDEDNDEVDENYGS